MPPGTKWETQAELKNYAETGWDPKDWEYLGEDKRVLHFVVTRKE